MADESAKEFSVAVKELKKASKELSQNTGKEVGKIVGKDLLKVTDPFVNSFKQIPGVATLGSVGKTLFNKSFAAFKDKREKELLAQRLGLTKEEFKNIAAQKRLNDALAKEQEKFGEAAKSLLGFDPEGLEKALMGNTNELSSFIRKNTETLEEQNKQEQFRYNKQQSTASKRGNRAAADEKAAEEAANEKKNQSLLESMANGITTLNKSFLLGLKEKGKFALAGLAALIAAPVVMLVEFFKSLSTEFKFLKVLVKGGFRRVTAPLRFIGRMFNSLIQLNKTAGAGPVQKAILGIEKLGKTIFSPFQKIGNFLQTIKSSGLDKVSNLLSKAKPALTAVKNFLAPVGKFFSTIFGLGKTLISASQSASGILKFAAGFGSILGKIFLPITILMSAFDFVTGFMEGYKKDGIIGGLRDGVSKLFANLIGAPLNLLKDGVAWVLKQFGFNESAEELKKFDFKKIITDIISWPYNKLLEIIDMVKNFDFSKLIPNNKLTRFLGIAPDEDKTPEQQAKEKIEEEAKLKAEAEKKAREKRMRELSRDVRRQENKVTYLGRDAEKQSKGAFGIGAESDEEHARDIAKYQAAQKELDAKKAELAALRAGGGTNVNASTTVNDARQSKTTNVTGAPIVDTTAAGAIANAI